MAGQLKFGMNIADDAESYMDAPQLPGGGKAGSGGNGSFIANVLDLLGIHHQVANGDPKQANTGNGPVTMVQPEIVGRPEPTNRPTSRDMLDASYTPIFGHEILDSVTNALKLK